MIGMRLVLILNYFKVKINSTGRIYTIDKNGSIGEAEEEIRLPQGLEEGSEFEMDADKDGTTETWIVLYKNSDNIEVISKETMGELTLGEYDTEAQKNATDMNNDGIIDKYEKAIFSYNNSIDRVNNYCESLIRIDNDGVRSVWSLPSDPNSQNANKPYAIKNLDKWNNKTAWEKYGILGECGDTNSNDDRTQMQELVIRVTNKEYWLASRFSNCWWNNNSSTGMVYFAVWSSNIGGSESYNIMWYAKSDGETNVNSHTHAVRPVIKFQYQ